MENNFFVGVVYHNKKLFKSSYSEKLILYSEDDYNYLDLLTGIWYCSDERERDYVDKNSIMITDISQYKIDYRYLLSKYKENGFVKRKKINIIKNR